MHADHHVVGPVCAIEQQPATVRTFAWLALSPAELPAKSSSTPQPVATFSTSRPSSEVLLPHWRLSPHHGRALVHKRLDRRDDLVVGAPTLPREKLELPFNPGVLRHQKGVELRQPNLQP